jgi:alpha-beta hydrolase superfamily lysophospholipase
VRGVSIALVALLVVGVPLASQAGGGPSKPLPPPVPIRPEPSAITLGDPAFTPLPDARADFGRLGGSVYQIEVPDHWNGRLFLFMHGYDEFRPVGNVSPPDIRPYLIGHGWAWGASSFSSTGFVPGLAADETAALWDYFARKYGRPTRTYINGASMGGLATNIAAERYANRYDGALALCGSASVTPALQSNADFFAAAAYVAGIRQSAFDATTDVPQLINEFIIPALQSPGARNRFDRIMVDLTGGPRPFAHEGFDAEWETNWRRATQAVTAHIAPNRDTNYRLGRDSGVSSRVFNRDAIRLPVDQATFRAFAAGNEVTGNLQMPLLALHTTGDGQVQVEQARIHQRLIDRASRSNMLVQRIIRDPSHCGFTNAEVEHALEALVAWVEHRVKPAGNNVLSSDLTHLHPSFEASPRGGAEGARVPGARERLALRGRVTLDGAPFDARFLGAIVRKNGLVTPCQLSIPRVDHGRYEITVLADAESRGCGSPGSEVLVWTFTQQQFFSATALRWPAHRHASTFNTTFSTAKPAGASRPVTEFSGYAYNSLGEKVAPGTLVEAFVGTTRCGIASVRRTGNFSGYIMSVVGPDSIPGCVAGATITFRVGGEPASNTAVNDRHGRNLDLTLR